jgi:hypothetical protein
MWRCSQPRVGVAWRARRDEWALTAAQVGMNATRSIEDEQLISLLGDLNAEWCAGRRGTRIEGPTRPRRSQLAAVHL